MKTKIARSAFLLFVAFAPYAATGASLTGRLTDPQGKPVEGAHVALAGVEAASGPDGMYSLSKLPAGTFTLSASAAGFADLHRSVSLEDGETATLDLRFQSLAEHTEAVTVTADVKDSNILYPDPAQRIFVREQILDANPGRPGAPVSIPGLPIETASSGIKAPQYFAPGVAGDHGEPIAMFFQVGSYLLPNNLSANAHGNGYADPNVMVPGIIESVQTDGGAFNVREGDHSVNLAAIYGFRSRLEPFVSVTGDYRDADVTAGWSPENPSARSWVAVQASYGNGFLDALEHRQQYKVNGYRIWGIGKHQLTLFGIGYYGFSKIPGLVPISVPDLHDTIDLRQRDQTHTGEIALNDIWHLDPSSALQLSGFFRTYNLSLYSNFGDGLVRQSEFRTVAGGAANYVKHFNPAFSIMGGMDYLREAPRRLDLDRYLSADTFVYGPFDKITANNLTIGTVAPYFAIDGAPVSWLRYNAGWRRDEISFDNTDLLHPENSFNKWTGFNSPKATVSLLPPDSLYLPAVSFSFGETFFTNDPRIGTGTSQGTLVSRTHSYQMVVRKTILGTDFRVTLGRVSQEASLAKIDADTGLQENEGPGRNRYITASARRSFHGGFLQASFSRADTRDLTDGTPIPEAPRLIVDVLGALDRLPWRLQARAEFEDVGGKPLGDGFTGVPVREFRGALARPFGRIEVGVNFLIASGFSGQTTEVLALPADPEPFERIVGVYIPTYVTLSCSYHFRPRLP